MVTRIGRLHRPSSDFLAIADYNSFQYSHEHLTIARWSSVNKQGGLMIADFSTQRVVHNTYYGFLYMKPTFNVLRSSKVGHMYETSSAYPNTTELNIVMSDSVGSSKELYHSNSLVLVCLAFCSDGKDACL